jgi:hypothetical protein
MSGGRPLPREVPHRAQQAGCFRKDAHWVRCLEACDAAFNWMGAALGIGAL